MSEYCDDHIDSVLLDKRRPKAKKDHICQVCGRIIPKGQRYIREVGLIDGDFFVSKRHTDFFGCDRENGEE